MKFVPLTRAARTDENLRPEYHAGRGIGVLTFGGRYLFFRRFRTVYYIPYEQISRYFRRIETVTTRIGCCTGDVNVENIVICTRSRSTSRDRELAQIELPGRKAALAAMEELALHAPDAASGYPGRDVPKALPQSVQTDDAQSVPPDTPSIPDDAQPIPPDTAESIDAQPVQTDGAESVPDSAQPIPPDTPSIPEENTP